MRIRSERRKAKGEREQNGEKEVPSSQAKIQNPKSKIRINHGFARFLPPFLVFLITFAVYVYTLCPTVYWDDAGELIAACYTLGIPHPPGHPLYAILGWLFTHIPVGSPAYRVNLMSAFFGALTCVVLFQIVRELIDGDFSNRLDGIQNPKSKIQNKNTDSSEGFGWGISTFAGIIAALSAGFSLILWDQSVVAETTTLHTFFMMVITLLVFRISAAGKSDEIQNPKSKIQNKTEPQTCMLLFHYQERLTPQLLILSFIYGLSFSNHVAGLFFAPSLAFVLLTSLRLKLFKPARLIAMIFLFALGLSVYAYLPLRSRFNPAVDWGNPETLENFLWVVTARQYSSDILRVPTLIAFKAGVHSMATAFLSNLTVLGCGFALVGALKLWKMRKSVLIYGVTVILILFFISLNSAFIFAYLAPAILLSAMWAGVGIAFLCSPGYQSYSLSSHFRLLLGHSREGGNDKKRGENDEIRLTVTSGSSESSTINQEPRTMNNSTGGVRSRALSLLAHCVAVLLVVILLFSHFPENNKRRYTYAKDYGEFFLSSLPENAILITGTADPLFISWYLQYCENYRTDVKVITRNALVRPGYLEQIHRQHPELNMPDVIQYENSQSRPRADTRERGSGLPWFANSYFKLFYHLNNARFPIFWEGIEANHMMIEQFVPRDFVFQIIPPGQSGASVSPRFLNAAEIKKRIDSDIAAGKVYGNHIFNYGVYSQWHNDTFAAMRHFQDSLELRPDDARALNNIGVILSGQGKKSEASEKFLAAYLANPGDATSNHNVGQVLLDRGEFRKAILHFQAAIALDPGNFEDYYDLGLCYAGLGKNASAADMLKKAVQIKPDSPVALSSLGVIYLRRGETESANKLLKLAVELEPGNAENWYNYACLQALKGDQTGSAGSLSKALTLDYKKTYTLASKDPRVSPILQRLLK
jgi:Flp pilus assembly protein TadD